MEGWELSEPEQVPDPLQTGPRREVTACVITGRAERPVTGGLWGLRVLCQGTVSWARPSQRLPGARSKDREAVPWGPGRKLQLISEVCPGFSTGQSVGRGLVLCHPPAPKQQRAEARGRVGPELNVTPVQGGLHV